MEVTFRNDTANSLQKMLITDRKLYGLKNTNRLYKITF